MSCLYYKTQFPSPEIGSSSIDWAQLSMFNLKTKTESSLRNIVFCNIDRMVFSDKDGMTDNVQKHNICTKTIKLLLSTNCNFIQHKMHWTTWVWRSTVSNKVDIQKTWRPRCIWENIKMDLTNTGWKGVNWSHMVQDMVQWQALVKTVMNL
jgi:hypothetical protein